MRGALCFLGLWMGLLLCGLPANCLAQWAPGGILVPGAGSGNGPRVIADGQGGVFIAWSDGRTHTDDVDIYAQHLTGAGTLAPGCPPAGIPVCTTPLTQLFGTLAPDGLGGAYLGWEDARIPGIGYTPCAQHVGPSGTIASGWPSDGLPVAPVGSANRPPEIAPDGAGGALLVWSDIRNQVDEDLYMQHLTATGSPASGWPVAGMPLAVFPGGQSLFFPILSDGSGGMIACWDDGRPGAGGVYMQHVLGDGSLAPGWPDGGLRVAQGRVAGGIVPDGAGGYYLELFVGSKLYAGQDSTYYILRVTGTGQTAPGWAANGTLVCDADFVRNRLDISADAAGHVFMAWSDYRGHGFAHIYATEMLPDGTFAPGWPVNGAPVSTYPGYQFNGDVLADGTGGVFIAGEYDGSGNDYAFIQHFAGNGTPALGWNAAGVQLNPNPNQLDPRLASDGVGGTIVAWRNGWPPYGVYAQRFLGDGVTPTLLSLASASAQSDRVSLRWQGTAAQSVTAAVERRTEVSGWQRLGSAVLEGSDRLRYDDREVIAGTRYAYRLSYTLGGVPGTTAETWVDVPATAVLALAGLRPNPSSSANLRVSFSLPDAGPARLELIDIAGRRVAALEVGSLGAGEHVEPLQPDARVPAGLYWLRLTQGARSLVTRAVVTG